MTRIDLDARRAEHAHEPIIVILDNTEYELPAALPLRVPHLAMQGRVYEAVEVLFGDDAEAAAEKLTLDDLARIIEGYGVEPGKASPSSDYSKSTGTRSKRTSPATTRSTSTKRASARTRQGRAGS